jgi:hypothetical protein
MAENEPVRLRPVAEADLVDFRVPEEQIDDTGSSRATRREVAGNP